MALDARAALERMLPHRPPMVMLDGIVAAEGDRVAAHWQVPSDSPWVREGLLDRTAFIEIAAQTTAVGAALRGRRAESALLADIRNLVVQGDAHVGDRIVCTVDVLLEFENLALVAFRVERSEEGTATGTLLAEGQLTVANGSGSERTQPTS